MLRRPECVLIDVDNTLLDFQASAEAASLCALREWGLDEEKFDFSVFTRINNGLWAALERGEIERGEIHRTRWQLIFDELGISADGEAFEQTFLAQIPHCVVPVEGAREILNYLSARYPVYAASNAPHEQQLTRLSRAGMLGCFRDVFTSERLGAAKPSSAFFEGVFRCLPGVLPENCVMIGDSVTADVVGAHRFGLQTVWFRFQNAPEPPFCPADAVVENLLQIKRLM